MKDIKQKIRLLRKEHLTIVQSGYLNGNADLDGESEFIEALIEEIIKPLAKEAFEDARYREEVFDHNGNPCLAGYMFKDSKDWIKRKVWCHLK